ncbi:conserved hypothetical protein [Uncinocarpus reesii 1704]|uniref:Cation efflux protein transmembrane domain-containing protein n=1 Tax=Uncinocarpus reesii (strain UAMH 1704) TaxID=336963 RepID=C4JRQ9_UNCRE|nr:uncharacterized protein UREG_05148 [Uncinocarpus reesii 1704]EEP80306.1 conserved hypothetical protein [Uncinocarpus reesii 1704]
MAPMPEGQNGFENAMHDASGSVPSSNQVTFNEDTILEVDPNIDASATQTNSQDPFSLSRHKKSTLSRSSIKADYPTGNHRKIHKYYTRQNALIDQFLQSNDEETLAAQDFEKNGSKVKWAVNLSFMVNFCLFIIQMYAAVSTGSLSLFATAADAFMDLVSSIVMLITSRMAARPKPHKYPVGRRRIETMGIILFCALMTTVAIQLIIESGRALGSGESEGGEELQIIPLVFVGIAIFSKFCLFCYCFWLRRYPAARIFFIDHRNDLAVNVFGLVMSVVGDRFVWYLDPIGAICIALLILFSWVSTAFENVWLLVGKSAPREFVNKCIYVSLTHDVRIQKVDTCRAYHAGELYYVEVDIIMDPSTLLRDSHDVSQSLQRKLEGLAAVERAFVHVDYEDDHNVHEEHKPLFDPATYQQPRTLKEWMRDMLDKIHERK